MNKIKYIIGFVSIFTSVSCEDYLDVVPDNVATIDNAFSDEVQARKYLFTCYSYLPNSSNIGGTPGWLSGDEFWVNSEQRNRNYTSALEIAEGVQNADSPRLNYYGFFFRGIRVCNTFISRIDDVRGMDDTDKKRWKSEAIFLKAYYHYYLIKMYGPIPLIDINIPISASPDEVRSTRKSFDECIDYVVDLLDLSAEGLPSIIVEELDELGRITKAIALSLKSEVLLTAASPLFNGNPDYSNFNNIDGTPFFTVYDAEKWKRAAGASLEAIEEAESFGNSLYTFSDLIVGGISPTTELKMTLRGRVTDKWNSEIIWSNTVSRNLQSLSQANVSGRHSATQQSLSPTLRIVKQYYTNNGVPVEEDKSWVNKNLLGLRIATAADRFNIKEGEEIPEMHFDREPRFYADLGFDRSVWFGQGRLDENDPYIVESRLGESAGKATIHDFSITGYFPKKLVNYKNTFTSSGNYQTNYYPFPIMRLSELYLSYAEAMNEYSGPSEDVYRYIDIIRNRAGLEGVVESWANNSLIPDKPSGKDGLRDIIHRERLIELSFENHRYWDLRRWKLAKNYMNSHIQGWDINSKEKGNYYKIVNIFDQKFEDKDYLWPIRTYLLIINTNLVQNPGW